MAASTVETTGFCFIPPGLSHLQRQNGVQCPSTEEVLGKFFICGMITVATNFFCGSDDARRRLLLFWGREAKQRRTWSSIWPGIATAAMHILFAMGVAGIMTKGGFQGSFTSLMLLWLTRPRFGAVTTLWMHVPSKSRLYDNILFDIFLYEPILVVAVLPIAMRFADASRSMDPSCDGVQMTPQQRHLHSIMARAGKTLTAMGNCTSLV
ncbi:hypothetical protein G7Z17_g1529 [Cylindrodendrum hubeiense]|uniref:Uncharacterized protein n=1 Tax=Cylindrodendrum hubeiense TaxID=595255 RepID=A0A9P5HEN2_9HYPO|nr:hypothetical protein G7Z17_g1529 [Cylindrodendrum hubeiense]